MKVKDATLAWLLVWTKGGNPLTTEHFFPTKGRSACGRVLHPRTQPAAIWIQSRQCKTCAKIAPKGD